jgi:hypothetical protein
LEYAINNPELVGVWAGTTVGQRQDIRTARNIAYGLSGFGKGSAGAAKKALKALAKYRTYEPATGKIERNYIKKNTKTYIVTGSVKLESRYLYTNKKTGKITQAKNIYHDKLPFNEEIQATSKADAKYATIRNDTRLTQREHSLVALSLARARERERALDTQ